MLPIINRYVLSTTYLLIINHHTGIDDKNYISNLTDKGPISIDHNIQLSSPSTEVTSSHLQVIMLQQAKS